MIEIKLSDSEMKFMNLIWDNAPINSTELVRIVEASLGWKKSTTYTVLRRLSQRGILKNENAVVTSIISKEEAQVAEVSALMERTFEGSLPAFIAALDGSRNYLIQKLQKFSVF